MALKPPYLFGRNTITCGYCKRTLPQRFCKRHQKQTVIRKVVYLVRPKEAHTQADIEGHGDDLWPEQTS